MTVAKSFALQSDVYTIVSGASLGVPVYDHVPQPVPDEYLRLDGFNILGEQTKAGEIAEHSFEVHHFDRPVAASAFRRGQTRTKTILAAVHAAIMATPMQGQQAILETQMVDWDIDGITCHGINRYTVTVL